MATAESVSLNLKDLEAPFVGRATTRRGPNLVRKVTWRNEAGLFRLAKVTTGRFALTVGEGVHWEVTAEDSTRPSFHIDYAFPVRNKLLVASSAWGVSCEPAKTTIQKIGSSLRELDGDVDSLAPDASTVFEAYDAVSKQPGELIIYRQGLINPDVMSVSGLFQAVRTYQD